MDEFTLQGVWTVDSVYKAIKKGFNSNSLKGISQNKNGNVFLISGLNKLKVTLKPKGNETDFYARMTYPFGWSPLGWVLIIPACLLTAQLVGIAAIVILWIISFKQEKTFNKEVFEYLNSFDISSIPDTDSSGVPQQSITKDSELSNNSEIITQIEKLARLRDEGILTQDELEVKKAKLLEAI